MIAHEIHRRGDTTCFVCLYDPESQKRARQAGVGAPLAWAFDQQANPGNAPAVLESLESFYLGRAECVATVAKQILCPSTVLLLSVFVGVIVYALFAPMVAMINATLEGMMP